MNLRKMENIEISRFTARIGDFILGFYLLCALFARRLATGWAGTDFGPSHQGDRIRTYGPLYPKQMR